MRLDHLLSKEHADPHWCLFALVGGGWVWCGGAPRSRTHVSCGDAHGWNINGFDARALRGQRPFGVGAFAVLVLLVQLRSSPSGGGCGGNVGSGVWGWVSGTLLGPEGPHDGHWFWCGLPGVVGVGVVFRGGPRLVRKLLVSEACW